MLLYCGKEKYNNHSVLLDYIYIYFYFRATLRVKEILQLSKKIDFDFLMIFDSTELPQSKNVYLEKNVCVCTAWVCVCLTAADRRA